MHELNNIFFHTYHDHQHKLSFAITPNYLVCAYVTPHPTVSLSIQDDCYF